MSGIPSWYGGSLPEKVHPPASYDEALEFFGWDPRFIVAGQEEPLVEWERRLDVVPLPSPLHFAGTPVLRVRVHFRVAPWAEAAFVELYNAGLWPLLDPYGGSYNFRLQKGGSRLSAHAFGAAFDFDPASNRMGLPVEETRFGKDPRGTDAVKILERWGFYWGGRFVGRPDAMHFGFGTGW